MNFQFEVKDTFNIIGRGTVLVGQVLEGQISPGEKVYNEDNEEIHVSAVERTGISNINKIGLLVRYDYEKSLKLIGKILKK